MATKACSKTWDVHWENNILERDTGFLDKLLAWWFEEAFNIPWMNVDWTVKQVSKQANNNKTQKI